MPNKPTTRFPARKRLIAAAISACFVSAPAWANPSGAQVVNGTASFNQSGNLLTVNNSNGAIINWNSFSIGANETTRFNQASAASSVLNRVVANDPSVLLGTLSSNGHVWLVNPAGILVGQVAKIDVAGFVASTLNVANQDFLAGRLNFGATANAGRIQNAGQITTPSGGSVYLVAPSVTNDGIINAPNGEVILAAGQTVQLVDTSTPGVTVQITGSVGDATNLGQIISEAGQIGIAGVLVNNSGTLNASSVVKQGGRIFLRASQDAYVDGAGRIVATGTKGGSIEVLGKRVAVTDNASLDASGQNGGGAVLVGGDAHGANPAVQNATTTYVGSNASIKADAAQNGDGGKVVVWSDDYTRFYGSISAEGGSQSGNGGFVETSGKQTLNFAGTVDTSAPNGKTGTLLLDPSDIVIADAAAGSQSQDSYGGTILFSDGVGTFTISTGTLELLSASTDISLQANNSITMEAISGSYTAAANTLTLQQSGAVSMATAYGGINLGSGNTIKIVGTGSLSLSAGTDVTVGPIVTNTGSVMLGAGNYANGSVTGSTIDTGGGGITLSGYGISVGGLNTSGPSYGGGVSITASDGTISVDGNIDTHGADGDGSYNGYAGGGVNLIRSGTSAPVGDTAVNVNGSIFTYGGAALTGSGLDGGEGGYVNIASASSAALIGNIIVSDNIDTHGGAGASAASSSGGWGSMGGSVYIAGNGTITVGNSSGIAINTAGGDSGNSGIGSCCSTYNGGSGGAVSIYGTTTTVNGSIDTHGGHGGDGGEGSYYYAYDAGWGGYGGSVQLGTDGSSVYDVNDSYVTTTLLHVTGLIDTHGGDGGNGLDDGGHGAGRGGGGGAGGSVQLVSTGLVTADDAIRTYGGTGGDGGNYSSYSAGNGANGGSAGSVDIYGGNVSVDAINAYGGVGGTGGDGSTSAPGGNGASGGNGSAVSISSSGDIAVKGTIDVQGGAAGNGGAYGGSGGYNACYGDCTDYGGAGSVTLDGLDGGGTVSFYSVVATGGRGGDGMPGGGASSGGTGGDGGNGGSVEMMHGASISVVSGGTGTINTAGGNGGNGGAGDAVYGGGSGGRGGSGAHVKLGASGDISTGSIDTHGGDGGNGETGQGASFGGTGGVGGYVDLEASSVDTTVGDGVGKIATYGGNGGNGGDGADGGSGYNSTGYGGYGAYGGYLSINLQGSGAITGDIDTHGGDGGNSGIGLYGYQGGDGGWGGTLDMANAASITTGAITTRGGNGGNGGGDSGDGWNSSYNPYNSSSHQGAGWGGDGGGISLNATGAVLVDGAIDASAGSGGWAGVVNGIQYTAGSGGNGGIGAYDWQYGSIYNVTINGVSISIGGGTGTGTGRINASGGNGGAGDVNNAGGNGGNSGNVYLVAPLTGGVVDFSNGGIYTLSGTAGASGSGSTSSGTDGSTGGWSITGDWVAIADDNFDFMANGTISANTFEFDPIHIDIGSFEISQASFAQLGGVKTVKFGNATTAANLMLSGPIDLTSTSTTTLGLRTGTGGTVSQDAMLAVGNLYAQGGSVSLTQANSVAKLQGRATSGNFAFNDSGALNVATVDSGSPAGVSATGSLSLVSAGAIELNGALNAGGIGDALVLAGTSFTNNAGASALSTSNGRWLVYSTDPVVDTPNLGGISYAFRQYNANYGNATPAQGGNGLLYSVVPSSITPSLTGTVSKIYDATTTATLGAANYSFTSGLNGDAIVFSGATSATYDTKNVGNGKLVTASGITISALDANSKPVYGYQLFTDTASAAIGTITPAALSISGITAANKVYDATTAATVSTAGAVYTGLLGSDAVTVSASGTFADKNVGTGKTVTLSSAYSGADVGNYSITDQASTSANITQRPLSTWIGGTSGNWSVASNWDALPDLSNVAAVSIPGGTTVTYDAAAGTTNLTSLTAGGLSIAGGTLNIADSLTVSSRFSQTGGTLGAFAGGSSASITQATGNLILPAITVANLDLSAPTGAITQSGPLAALTLMTQSQGATTLDNPNNQVAGRIDMTAGGPLSLWASGDLNLGAIDAGANAVVIKAGGAILQAPGTESSTNIIASSADLSSIFGGASGDLAISANTQVTGALTATVGTGADFGGIRIQNTGAQPASVTLTDNALAGASVSFLNTGDITSTSGVTLATLTGGDLALLSNGNITWDGGSLATPTGSVLISADGSLGVTGALSSPVDLALSSTTSINVGGSVVTAGSGTASFTAPSVALNGSVDSADDVGIIATTLDLGAGSSTGAAHDVIFAADNIAATNATVSAGHDISAAVTGDMRLNGSGFTAGNDIYVTLLGATSTLYLNDTAGLPPSFLWAQAPSTIHLNYAAEAFGGMVVDGIAVDPLTFVSSPGGSGLLYGAAKAPATPGAGLDVVYGVALGTTDIVAPTLVDALIAAISSSTTSVNPPAGTLPPGEYGNGLGSQGNLGDQGQTIGGTEGTFGGDEEDEDKNKTDEATGLKKDSNKPVTKKLSTCS